MDLGKLLSDELWKLPPYFVPRGRAVPSASCWSELEKGSVSLFPSYQLLVDISIVKAGSKNINGRKKGHLEMCISFPYP